MYFKMQQLINRLDNQIQLLFPPCPSLAPTNISKYCKSIISPSETRQSHIFIIIEFCLPLKMIQLCLSQIFCYYIDARYNIMILSYSV